MRKVVGTIAVMLISLVGGMPVHAAPSPGTPISMSTDVYQFSLRPSDMPKGFIYMFPDNEKLYPHGARVYPYNVSVDIKQLVKFGPYKQCCGARPIPSPYGTFINLTIATQSTPSNAATLFQQQTTPHKSPWNPHGVGDQDQGWRDYVNVEDDPKYAPKTLPLCRDVCQEWDMYYTLRFRRANELVTVSVQGFRATLGPGDIALMARIVDQRIQHYIQTH